MSGLRSTGTWISVSVSWTTPTKVMAVIRSITLVASSRADGSYPAGPQGLRFL